MSSHDLKTVMADPSDVLIVGAGLAGLFIALKLSPRPVTVLASQSIGNGASSSWAQGGMAVAVQPGDTTDAHAADTIAAGAGIVDAKIAHMLAEEGPARVQDLLEIGVPFDTDESGALKAGLEAAHSAKRIIHVKGDQVGHAIMEALIARVRATPSIRVVEDMTAYELALAGKRVSGVYACSSVGGGASTLFPAGATILATGGVGGLYKVTTNPTSNRGQGFAMAARAGAILADPEFVQFHPTAIAADIDPAPLLTEALRGDGAHLVDGSGHRFMPAIHDQAELAPRDIVARAIAGEIRAGRVPHLDVRPLGLDKAGIGEAFPTLMHNCDKLGIDPATQPIPVAPAVHYHMGGIAVDGVGRTSLDGLWACGEVASTGAHGANRLASNSLLEAVVFGARIAEDLRDRILPEPIAIGPSLLPVPTGGVRAEEGLAQLRALVAQEAGVVRDHAGLARLLDALAALQADEQLARALPNSLMAARIIAAAALARTESRGGHFREDFPVALEPQAHRSFFTLSDIEAIDAQRTRSASPSPVAKEAVS